MEEPREKRVLIISYYWPPSGGSGVQRWLKFTKYLPAGGWLPVVFTPENPAFELRDPTLEGEVHPEVEVLRFPIWEPYRVAGIKAGTAPPGNGRTLISRVMRWVRGNLILPDPRVFWVRPAASFLIDYLRDTDIRVVITTGPPHSIHLIGRRIKRKLPGIRWIADMRDPWSEWGLLDTLHTGKMARRFHRQLERSVLREASEVMTITPFYQDQFQRLGGRKVQLFPNGFDQDDFVHFSPEPQREFLIRHSGVVNEKCNPIPVLAALLQWSRSRSVQLVVDFTGKVTAEFKHAVQSQPELAAIVRFTDPVPHAKLIELYRKTSVLLLVLTGYKDAEGYMPGKLFEYLATGLPVLGAGPPDGDAARLLNDTQGGAMFHESDPRLTEWLDTCYQNWSQGRLTTAVNMAMLENYTRKGIALRLARWLDQLR